MKNSEGDSLAKSVYSIINHRGKLISKLPEKEIGSNYNGTLCANTFDKRAQD